MSSPDSAPLGTFGGVSARVLRTDTPWSVGGIDALVVSVGGSLGNLGTAMAARFPEFRAAVDRVELSRIRPSEPVLIRPGPLDVRSVLLVSPHDDDGEATMAAVRLATYQAVLSADEAGAIGVGIPLLATGALGLDHQTVADIAVPAVIDALRALPRRSLSRVVFFGTGPDIVPIIERAWRSRFEPVSSSTVDYDTPPTELTGGVTSDLVDPAKPIPMARDRMDVGVYVSMLATVIAERATPTPLSIGVFGEWGTGKSFFMGMLRGRIDELTAGGTPRYCGRVVQIGFNAWHYADTNLWASLADVIFRALAGPEQGPERQRSELQRALVEKVGRQVELAELNERAEAEVSRLQAEVDRAADEHRAGVRELLVALRDSRELRRIWQRIGVNKEVEQGRLLSRELRDIASDVDTIRTLPMDRNGKLALAAAGVVLGVSAAAALAVPLISLYGGAASLVLASLGGRMLVRARRGLGELRSLAEDIRGGLDHGHEERVRHRVADTMRRLRTAEADHLVTQAQLAELVTHAGELRRQLADLNPAHRMSAFLTGRAKDEVYTRGLGVVSTLRKDFEQLAGLLADWRANPDADSATPPIDRVVLHIDDLDRCEPRQVVQVMEAVHLMLAMDLFVVVVGVDPRWLVHSLRSHYAAVLDHADGTAEPWRVPPEDYLEKIINIPFTLPGMVPGTLGRVLRSMTEPDAPGRTAKAAPPPESTVEGPSGGLVIEPGAPLAAPREATPARSLTEAELTFLDALEPLIDTPRAAKRLFNVYRMIRATRDLSEAAHFLGGYGRPGEFEAVIVLLGIVAAAPSLAAAVLAAPPDPMADGRGGLAHRDGGDLWRSFAADLEPRDGRSPIVGAVTSAEAAQWLRLHDGLRRATDLVTLPDLTVFQQWAPRVRRFSYSH